MMDILRVVVLVGVVAATEAIQCNFAYTEANVSTTSVPGQPLTNSNKYNRARDNIFDCTIPGLEEYEEDVNFNIGTRIEVDYDLVEVNPCDSVTKTINVKALTNIHNVNKTVEITRIKITECINAKQNCATGTLEWDKKMVCIQNHVQIVLNVVDHNGKVIGKDDFYYPAGCECKTFVKRRRSTTS